MRFSFALVLLIAVSFMAVSGEAQTEPLRVGVSLPLSGPLAEYGTAVRNGIELAVRDSPRISELAQFVYDDNRYDPKQAITSITKLVDINRVDLLFMWGTEPGIAVAPIVEKRRVPTLIVAQDATISAGKEFVLRYINPSRDFAALTVKHLRSLGVRRIGVVQADISFCDIMVEDIRRLLTPQEELSVIATLQLGDSDVRSMVTRARRAQSDILGLYLSPAQIVAFYREAIVQRLSIPTFGSTSFESELVLKAALQGMEGAFFVHGKVDQRFQERYQEVFGGTAEISYAAQAYEFARLVGDLGGKSPAVRHLRLLEAIRNSGVRDGVVGQYRYKESAEGDRYFEFPLVVKAIRNGRLVELP